MYKILLPEAYNYYCILMHSETTQCTGKNHLALVTHASSTHASSIHANTTNKQFVTVSARWQLYSQIMYFRLLPTDFAII